VCDSDCMIPDFGGVWLARHLIHMDSGSNASGMPKDRLLGPSHTQTCPHFHLLTGFPSSHAGEPGRTLHRPPLPVQLMDFERLMQVGLRI
jgi:hypothetical protein